MSNKVIVDTDAFLAWFMPDDLLHQEAVRIAGQIKQHKAATFLTNLVVAETSTALSNRAGQQTAIEFLDFASNLQVINVNEDLHSQAVELFRQKAKKGTSLTDCANVVVAQAYNIPAIFSFDRFYRSHLEILI